jgi:hypothetical protein
MVSANTLAAALDEMNACREAVEWVGDRSLATAWAECKRPDWMLWICGRMADEPGWPARRQIVLVACDIAESVLPIFEAKYPADFRPRKAIETRAFGRKGRPVSKTCRRLGEPHTQPQAEPQPQPQPQAQAQPQPQAQPQAQAQPQPQAQTQPHTHTQPHTQPQTREVRSGQRSAP